MKPATRWIALLSAALLAQASAAVAQENAPPAEGDADAAPETIAHKPKAMDLDALLLAVQQGWEDERAENQRLPNGYTDVTYPILRIGDKLRCWIYQAGFDLQSAELACDLNPTS